MHACRCMPPPCGHLPTTVVRFFPNEALNVQVRSSQRLQKIAAHASQWAYGHNATCGASGLHLSGVIGAQMGAHVMAGACRRMQTDRFHQAYRTECNACASMHHATLCFPPRKMNTAAKLSQDTCLQNLPSQYGKRLFTLARADHRSHAHMQASIFHR